MDLISKGLFVGRRVYIVFKLLFEDLIFFIVKVFSVVEGWVIFLCVKIFFRVVLVSLVCGFAVGRE